MKKEELGLSDAELTELILRGKLFFEDKSNHNSNESPMFTDHTGSEDACNDRSPTIDWWCTRTKGHKGPHEGLIASKKACARWK